MRYLLPLFSLAAAVAAVFFALRQSGADPAAKIEDSWVGTYATNAVNAERITISKEGDGYKLSHFEHHQFKEVKKGVLAGDGGGLGYVYLGSMEFSDGRRAKVLHADFCYQWFYLMTDLDDGKKPAENATTEKKTPPMKVEEAEKLVRDFIFKENPKMNPEAQFPVKDITIKAVWDRLGAQVFQVTEGVRAHETYVIKDKKVYHIGSGFGGHGVASMVVADPNGDGRDKLIFAYSWGSGIHRSHVGVFDLLAKEPEQVVAAQAYYGGLGDLMVQNGEKQTVEVFAGKEKVGRLILEGKEGALKVAIRLSDDLSADAKKGFKGVD
jgi:hypothetical protein